MGLLNRVAKSSVKCKTVTEKCVELGKEPDQAREEWNSAAQSNNNLKRMHKQLVRQGRRGVL